MLKSFSAKVDRGRFSSQAEKESNVSTINAN